MIFSFSSIRPILIASGLVLVALTLVIPLPAPVLDAGIAISVAMAVLILSMAVLVERPTDFQAFPLLLLLSLLVRLSLNVSSTRLILTNGHSGPDAAGRVIGGFSDFVAGGSLLIGFTVFSVISIVNFMVITKGSGRMAEVSARFALDSLPGKQLAIDGDLNSGSIDHDEAKRRRINEQREISFYGALDGASKFVKGDAIAGLLITLVNLFVGLGAGVFLHGLSVAEAFSTFSRLTIGDGLVSQMPALITSISAALLLSRGGATETTSDLLVKQITSNWHVPAIVAGGLVVISIIPGMPLAIFLFISCAFAAAAWLARHGDSVNSINSDAPAPYEKSSLPRDRIGDALDAEEISVEIGAGLIASALDHDRGLGQRIINLRLHVARNFGLILPDVRITDSATFAEGEYLIRIQSVVRARGLLRPEAVLILGSDEAIENISGESVHEPVYGSRAKWITLSQQHDASIAGATVVSPMEVLSTHLMEVVRSHLAELMTMSAMQRMIRELCDVSDAQRAQANQKFFGEMVPDKVTPELLLTVLRGMLEERLSIRNLVLITDAVYEARNAASPEAVYELVRRRMRGQICDQYASSDGQLDILQLHPKWESELSRVESEGARSGGAGMPHLQKNLSDSVRSLSATLNSPGRAVLAVPDHRRRLIRIMLASAGVDIPVLGLEEIDPALRVRLCGTVTL